MREKQGRGGRRNAQGGDGETHIFRDGRTDGQTDGQTDTGSYRSGAHLKTRPFGWENKNGFAFP